MRKPLLYVWVFLCLVVVTVAFIPGSWFPASWKSFASATGTFGGGPVTVAVPGHIRFPAKAEARINMERGACDVSFHASEEEKALFAMGQGVIEFPITAGGLLVLDPAENPGTYSVFIGSKWHPLAPRGRMVVLFFCFASLVPVVLKKRLASLTRRIGNKRVFFVIAVWAAVCFFYSVVHEFGHYSVGVMLGGTVDDVTWTILSGEKPHVSFRSLPAEAIPWMSAAGTMLPVILGFMLLTVWMVAAPRLSWYFSAALAASGLALLIPTLGAIFDVLEFDSLPYSHMGALAWHLGLRGWSMVFFVLSPLALALLMDGLFAYRLHGITKNRRLLHQAEGAA